MSDHLTPDDLERMRAKAEAVLFVLLPHPLNDQKRELAEMVERLLDEVERLRGERDSYKLTVDSWIEAASVLPPSQQTYGAIGRIVRDGTQ